jgi:glycosyltransferase involved in cell wall biosynthesis
MPPATPPTGDAPSSDTERPRHLVSIVLPTLNGERYIHDAIASILGQTYRHLEVIVVDGGSTDGTLERVTSAADPRITVIHQHDRDGRLAAALNEGFAHAAGTYWTWAQDDDIYAPGALAVMVEALDGNTEIGLVYAGFHFIDEHGCFIRAATLGPSEGLSQSNVVGHCFLYRRSVAETVGRYDPAFDMAEDLHFWLRISRRTGLLHLPGCYYFHRLHGGSLTVRDYGSYRALRVAARARREVLGIGRWEYLRQMSGAYARQDMARLRRCLIHGVTRNPAWLRNRGVLSLAWRSLRATAARPRTPGAELPS